MYIKENVFWKKKTGIVNDLDNLKMLEKHEKCFKSANYSITNDLQDIYNTINYYHVLWAVVTDLVEQDTLTLIGKEFKKDKLYNLLKYFDIDTLFDSDIFVSYMIKGYFKLATNEMFDKDNKIYKTYFEALTPYKENYYLDKRCDYTIITYKPNENSSEISTLTKLINIDSYKTVIGFKDDIQTSFSSALPLNVGNGTYEKIITPEQDTLIQYIENGNDNEDYIYINNKKICFYFGISDFKVDLNAFFYYKESDSSNICNFNIKTYIGDTEPLQNGLFDPSKSDLVQTYDSVRYLNNTLTNTGYLCYNRDTKNMILDVNMSSYLTARFEDLINITNFDTVVWGMKEYSNMLGIIDFHVTDFSDKSKVESIYQTSDNYGYTIKNLYTTDKVWSSMLNNYHVIDYASTEFIDIAKEYDSIKIDNNFLVNGNLVLLKDQTDASKNNVYVFNNKKFSPYFTNDSDFPNLILYVKYGNINSNKEFYLDTTENGEYVSLYNENFYSIGTNSIYEFNFIENDTYVIHNKFEYKLLDNHTITNSDYQKSIVYDVLLNPENKLYISDNTYIQISDDFLKLNYVENEVIIYSHSFGDYKKAITRILKTNLNTYLIVDNTLVSLFKLTSFEMRLIDIYQFNFEVVDFCIKSDNEFYVVDTNNNLYYVEIYNTVNITTYVLDDVKEIILVNDCILYTNQHSIKAFNTISETYYTIITSEDNNISSIYYDSLNNINYLNNNIPSKLYYNQQELENLHNIQNKGKYLIKDFSNTEAGDWKIINNKLYLKGVSVDKDNLPKINNLNYTYLYDNTITLDNEAFNSLTDSFTIEFKAMPVVVNSGILYCEDNYGNYMKFITNDESGFPSFIISYNNITYKSELTKKLNQDVLNHISIMYSYNSGNLSTNVYIDGILYCSGNFLNAENILNTTFTNCFIGGDTESKSYIGGISNFRIWNIKLTQAQINILENQNEIDTHNSLYVNLISNWLLKGQYNTDISQKNDYTAIINDTINDEPLLKNLDIVKNIQISDTELYVLEERTQIIYEDNLDNSIEYDILWINDYTNHIKEYDGTSSALKLTSIIFPTLMSKDFTDVDVHDEFHFTFEYLSNDDSNNRLWVGGYFYNSPTSYISTSYNTQSRATDGWVTVNCTHRLSPNNYGDTILKYFFTITSTYPNGAYIRNLRIIKTNTYNPLTVIYKIGLLSEKVSIFKESKKINNIYYNDSLYYLQDKNIYNENDLLILESVNPLKSFAIGDENNIFTVSESNKVYNNNTEIFTLSYGYDTFFADNTTFYYVLNNILHIVVKQSVYNDISQIKLSDQTSNITIDHYNNDVYINNTLLDANNQYFKLFIKDIIDVYALSENEYIIISRTLNNDVNLWKWNYTTNNFTRFCDDNLNHILLNNDSNLHFKYFVYKQESWIILSSANTMYYYIIDVSNVKFSYYTFEYFTYLDNSNIVGMLNINDMSSFQIVTKEFFDDKYYVGLYEINKNFSLPLKKENISTITYNGSVVGKNGIMFDDNVSFDFKFKNLQYRENINDVCLVPIKTLTTKGYYETTYSDKKYFVGDNGLLGYIDENNDIIKIINTNITHNINSISFYDENLGIMVGDNNTIIYTFNGGESLGYLNFDFTIQHWNKILFVQANKAIIIGNNGKVISLSLENNFWKIDKINDELYNIPLMNGDNYYAQNLNDIIHVGLNKFMLCGDNNFITILSLKYLATNITYSNVNLINNTVSMDNWNKIKKYYSNSSNEYEMLILGDKGLYKFEYDIIDIDYEVFLNKINDDNIEVVDFNTINDIIFMFDKVNAYKLINNVLYTKNNEDLFIPRLLFLNYNLAKKINSINYNECLCQGNISKLDMDCYKFKSGDYISFGSSNNNYLTYQDFYYLNRQVLDVPNMQGKIQNPYNTYNKKISVDESESYYTTDYNFINTTRTNLDYFVSPDIRYDDIVTKLYINKNYITNNNVYIIVADKDKNKTIKAGDYLFIQLEAESFNYFDNVLVNDNNENGLSITVNNNIFYFSHNTTVEELLNYYNSESILLDYINIELSNRGIKPKLITTEILVSDLYSFTSNKTFRCYAESDDYIFVGDATGFVYVYDKTFKLLSTIKTTYPPTEITYIKHLNQIIIKTKYVDENLIVVRLVDFNQISVNFVTTAKKISNIVINDVNEHFYYSIGTDFKIINNSAEIGNIVLNKSLDHLFIYDEIVYGINNYGITKIVNENTVEYLDIPIIKGTDSIEAVYGDYIYLYDGSKTILIFDIISNTVVKEIDTLNAYITYHNTYKIFYIKNKPYLFFGSDSNIKILSLLTNEIIKTINTTDHIYNLLQIGEYIYAFSVNNLLTIIDDKLDTVTSDYDYLDYTNKFPFVYYSGLTNNIILLSNSIKSISKETIYPSGVNIDIHLSKTEISNIVTENLELTKYGEKYDYLITLHEKFSDEMVYELNNNKLIIYNLNTFNGDLLNLKCVFDKHLLSECYDMDISSNTEYITISANINDRTKFYNLESDIIYKINDTTYNTSISYNENLPYNPNYSIYNILNKLNPSLFNSSYNIENLPSIMAVYGFDKPLYEEFTIDKSMIYISENTLGSTVLIENIFYDIEYSLGKLTQLYLKRIDYSYYKNTNIKRYCLLFDKILENKIINLNTTFTLKARSNLYDISKDLDMASSINFPIYNSTNDYFNSRYFNTYLSTKSYMKILCNDSNIRKYVSVIVGENEFNDIQTNIINWKDDPNIIYYPIEIFGIGCDKKLKYPVVLDNTNFNIDNSFGLSNVDFNKYSFRLTDNLTISTFEEKYPWMFNNLISNALIGEDENGLVWYYGDFICGEWIDGTFHSGNAYNILWYNGIVTGNTINNISNKISIGDYSSDNTHFYQTIWNNGVFNGTWYNGTFNSGYFNGTWYNGTFNSGYFNGEFLGGQWINGNFESGSFISHNSLSVWNMGKFLGGEFGSGIWKNGYFSSSDLNNLSKFGTHSTKLNPAIWEYGVFDKGEFYSNIDYPNNTSKWYNGVFMQGYFNGGTIEHINWLYGIFNNGYIKSSLVIESWKGRIEYDIEGTNIEIKFNKPHYFKTLYLNDNKIENYFYIKGNPIIEKGMIHPNTKLLGYNAFPQKHEIKEIIDDYTILIYIENTGFPYPSNYIIDNVLEFVDYDYLLKRIQFNTLISKLYSKNDNMYFLSKNVLNSFDSNNPSSEFNLISTNHNSDSFLFLDDRYFAGNSDIDKQVMCYNYNGELLYTKNYSPVCSSSTKHIFNRWYNMVIFVYSRGNTIGIVTDIETGEGFEIIVNNGIITSISTLFEYVFIAGGTGIQIFNLKTMTIVKKLKYDNKNILDVVSMETDDSFLVVIRTKLTTYKVDGNLNIEDLNYYTNGMKYLKHANDSLYILSEGLVYRLLYTDPIIESLYNFSLIEYSIYYNIFLIVSDNILVIYNNNYEYLGEIKLTDNIKQIIVSENGKIIYVITVNNFMICLSENKNIFVSSECSDYTILENTIISTTILDLITNQYETMDCVSYWKNGKFINGIIENIYFENGKFLGGLWLDGVSDNGIFGE